MPAYSLRRLKWENEETAPPDREDYTFLVDGKECGRTYRQKTPIGWNWYWAIYGTAYKGVVPEGVSVQGAVETLEEAKAIFKENFERLIESGNVKD